MKAIIKLVLMGVAVMISAYVVPGVSVSGFWVAVIAAVILSIMNFVIKPILVLFTLPINIMTLGLFTFIINAVMVLLVSSIVPGFVVSSLLSAVLFSVILSIVNGFLGMISE